MVPLLLILLMLFAIFTIYFAIYQNMGCYHKNGTNLCKNWEFHDVTIKEYSDVYVNSEASPSCNCNVCIQSNSCDCDYLECYLVGSYNNNECKIAYDFVPDREDNIYSTEWSYTKLNNTYKIGKDYKFYSNRQFHSDKCFLKQDVNENGEKALAFMILMIITIVANVGVCCLMCYEGYRYR